MGKFFGLMACLGTAAVVSGCVKVPEVKRYKPKTADEIMEQVRNTPKHKELERTLKLIKDMQTCQTSEADQKISEAAEANSIATELTAEVQNTLYKNAQCSGKDVLVEKVVYEGEGAVVVPGPSITSPIDSVEISSVRTCATNQSDSVVADVTQAKQGPHVIEVELESDGDVKIPLTNSIIKTPSGKFNVAAGKNLVKLKYYACSDWQDTIAPGGSQMKTCIKKNQVAEKEVVLNVTVAETQVGDVREVYNCFKTDDQEQ